MGRVTPDEARRVLREDVVLSEAMTEQEVERYMFRTPGQATSYFYGYTQLRDLRDVVERALGNRFDARAFHDFILGQGLLPPKLLRDAVLERFTRARLGAYGGHGEVINTETRRRTERVTHGLAVIPSVQLRCSAAPS